MEILVAIFLAIITIAIVGAVIATIAEAIIKGREDKDEKDKRD